MFVFFIFSSDGRSWAASRASVGGPGPLSVPLWVAPSRSQGLCGRCWPVLKLLWAVLGSLRSALRCYVGGLGPLLGPMFAVLGLMLAVLGRSWGLCWRSWRLLGPLLAVLGRLGPKNNPNPSGKAIRQGNQPAQNCQCPEHAHGFSLRSH